MADILTARNGPVETITINRPEAFNAFTPDTINDLGDALRAAAGDRRCRAIVLTGAGERAFCAGTDVKAVADRDEAADGGGEGAPDPILSQFESLHLKLSGIVRTIHTLPVPVIAAVNGHAIGGGFAFAAACDLRLASPQARFANGFVKRGISGCEMGLSYFLPKIVGAAQAFDWMLTGRPVDADEALGAGLVGRIVPAEQLVESANALGQQIAENAPMAIAMTKEVMWANVHAVSLDQALALESRTQVMTRNTADAKVARSAFLEKRAPDFGGGAEPRPLR